MPDKPINFTKAISGQAVKRIYLARNKAKVTLGKIAIGINPQKEARITKEK